MKFTRLGKSVQVTLIIQSIGMLMGASTHITWIVRNGFLSDQYNAPIGTALFWDSLTLLDLLAASLLILKPKAGILLTFSIVIVDVVHNNLFHAQELYFSSITLGTWLASYWMILGQILFLFFVALTMGRNLKAVKNVASHGVKK